MDISVPLDNACTSQSYHLIIDGQEGVFVGHQRSLGLERRIVRPTLDASLIYGEMVLSASHLLLHTSDFDAEPGSAIATFTLDFSPSP